MIRNCIFLLLFGLALNGFTINLYATDATVYLSDEEITNAQNEDESRRPQIRKVRFKGNKTFPKMILREIIATRQPSFFRRLQFWKKDDFYFVEQDVRRDVIRIKRFYNRRGFYEANISYTIETGKKEHQRIVIFEIDEGPSVKVRSLEYTFITDDPETEKYIRESRTFYRANTGFRNPFLIGNRYELIKHSEMESKLTTRIMDLGYAFVKVNVEAEIDTLALQSDVHITIEPGPVAYFNELIIEGEETVSKSLVAYQSDVRKGQLFSLTKIRRAQQLLFRHPLFRFATVNMTDQEESDKVDIRLRVREFPLRSVELQGGLGDEEIVRGRVSWMHRNPFGNGHRFSIAVRGSFIEQRLNMEYLIPGMFTPRSNLSFTPFILRVDERNYLLNSGGLRTGLSYYHDQYFVANLGHEYSQNKIYQKDASVVRRDSTSIFDVSSITLSALYNESNASRGRGWAFRPYIEISGFFNTGTLTYNKFALDVRRFIDITPSTQIAMRVDNGVLFSSSPFSIPANIRFYSGGTSSVRGWSRSQLGPKRVLLDENGSFREFIPVGGRALSMFNLEIRQDLPLFENGVMVVAFLDGGQVWLDYDDFNPGDYQFGAGGGVRYLSPIGPIRLDFGYKLNPSESDLNQYEGVNYGGANRWGIHFSIGQAF